MLTHTTSARTATGTAVHLDRVSKTYPDGDRTVAALDDVTLHVAPGSFTAVMGPSGSGKSTFLSCAAELDTPSSGRVVIGGTDLSGMTPDALTRFRRRHVGFVFQGYNLVPHLTVAENVRLPLTLAGAGGPGRPGALTSSPSPRPRTAGRRGTTHEPEPLLSPPSRDPPDATPWSRTVADPPPRRGRHDLIRPTCSPPRDPGWAVVPPGRDRATRLPARGTPSRLASASPEDPSRLTGVARGTPSWLTGVARGTPSWLGSASPEALSWLGSASAEARPG